MRLSFSLALISFLASFASGFSTSTGNRLPRAPFVLPSKSANCIITPSPLTVKGGAGFGDKKSLGASSSSSSDNTNVESSKKGPIDTGSKCPVTGLAALFGSVYGTGGVIYILLKAIKRVLPIAMEPFQSGAIALSQFELGAYIVTCLWFAYVEGYKGFQLKFSPLVVKRSFTLVPAKNGTKWWHFFLAPLYSMGLFHATKKRKIVSWSVSIGIAAIVAVVKRLPYPWRNIVDAGVVVGLTWGSLSILVLYLKAWVSGQPPKEVDAALPVGEPVK